MDRGEGSSPVRTKRFGRIDPFCWIPVVSLVTIAALMVVSGAAPFGAALLVFALLLMLFDSWVNRPDPRAEQPRPARSPARSAPPAAAEPTRVRPDLRPHEENRPRPPQAERPRNVPPPPPPMRNRPPMPPRQQPPRMDPRGMPRQPPPPPPRRPGPRSGAGA